MQKKTVLIMWSQICKYTLKKFIQGCKIGPLHTLLRHLNMFLDILECRLQKETKI